MKPEKIRKGVLRAMFLLGTFATLAQVTFVREMLVVFHGNELTIGLILGSWLIRYLISWGGKAIGPPILWRYCQAH